MKDNLKYEYELATIMKKVIYQNNSIGFIPEKVVEGYYEEKSKCFVDFDGTIYFHIITDPLNYGFCNRVKICDIKKKYPLLPLNLIKSIILHMYKKYAYVCENETDTELRAPIISVRNKKCEFDLEEEDISEFYQNNFLDYYNYLNGIEKEEVDKEEISEEFTLNDLLNELNSKVNIDESNINEILSTVLKHQNNFDDDASYMLLNSDFSNVKKIFDIISKRLDIPINIVTLNPNDSLEFVGQTLGQGILDIVNGTNCNYEKSEKSILIIRDIDKFVSNSNFNSNRYQKKVVDLLNSGFMVKVNDEEHKLDLDKLLIVGVGTWDKLLKVGFNDINIKNFNHEFVSKYGMIDPFLEKFKYFIEVKNMQKETSLKEDIISKNKLFFENYGVELKIEDDFICEVKGSSDINTLVEKALSLATIEILSNPNMYSKLIIDKEILNDNKKYKLLKRNNG